MEQASTPLQAASGANPLDQNGLCLLSLDGGGVRGLSTLYILKGLMTRLNMERQAINLKALKPCEVFDLVGGTSTGGLIAIMLGRLEMDVDECIMNYIKLMENIFDERSKRLPFGWKGQVKPQFNSTRLESAIKKVITTSGAAEADLFNDGNVRGCKVFVCTTAKETKGIARLRSYSIPGEVGISATICEAALATSAATTFFDPVSIGVRKYVDGALGANNPVDEVESEASNIWCPQTGDLKPLVKCFISVGTGNPGKKAIEDNMLKFLSKTLVGIATDTEKTAERFIDRWRQHFDEKRYFRFNVHQGLQDVSLAEYQERGTIEATTDEYLKHQEQKFRVRDCVQNLKHKENKTENHFEEAIKASNIFQRDRSLRAEPAHWFVPLIRNKHFVGRSSQLDELETKLFAEGYCQKVAIRGLGGIGKTQIALELAYRSRERCRDCSVFWIPANNANSFEQACLEIAQLLQINGQQKEKSDAKKLVKHWLSQESAGQWLLILDNVDDVDIAFESTSNGTPGITLLDYIPTSSKGSIVFTTRDRKAAVKLARSNVIEIPEMDEDTAAEVLSKALIDPTILHDPQTTTNLLTQLTCLPLAIVQAATYINKTGLSVLEYLSLFEDTKEEDIIEVLSEDFEDDGRYKESNNPVATTWLISFEQIQRHDPLAAQYLSFMSCIDSKHIPQSLLPLAQSKKQRLDAIGTLSAFSFIAKRSDDLSFDLHRLVHLATRNWLRHKSSLAEQVRKAVARLAEVFADMQPSELRRLAAYIPHAQFVLTSEVLNGNTKEEITLLEAIGRWMSFCGRYYEAEKIFSKVFRWRKSNLGPEHTDTFNSGDRLAAASLETHNYEAAEKISQQLFNMKVTVLGQEHSDTLASMNNVARAFHGQGRWKEAEDLQREVLEKCKTVLGPEHQRTVISMNNLGMTFLDQGRLKEAEALQVEAVKLCELSPEHPERLNSMSNLACIFHKQRRWKKAEELLIQVMNTSKKVLGQEHPDTMLSMNNLAGTWRSKGCYPEAIKLMEECVELRRKVLGIDHPDTKHSFKRLNEWRSECSEFV